MTRSDRLYFWNIADRDPDMRYSNVGLKFITGSHPEYLAFIIIGTELIWIHRP